MFATKRRIVSGQRKFGSLKKKSKLSEGVFGKGGWFEKREKLFRPRLCCDGVYRSKAFLSLHRYFLFVSCLKSSRYSVQSYQS